LSNAVAWRRGQAAIFVGEFAGELLGFTPLSPRSGPGRSHRRRSDAGENLTLGQVSVADDLSATVLVGHVRSGREPRLDLVLDGVGNQALGSVLEYRSQGLSPKRPQSENTLDRSSLRVCP
jgi:hypothetical protein